jgi:hypothetical protein
MTSLQDRVNQLTILHVEDEEEKLWNHMTTPSQQSEVAECLQNSKHRVNETRIRHLSAWIFEYHNSKAAWQFIKNNIDDKYFYAFVNIWDQTGCDTVGTTKTVRLSNTKPGQITLSVNYGCDNRRYQLDEFGRIEDGNYKFRTVTEFMDSLSSDCSICYDSLLINTLSTLSCGHKLHSHCLSQYQKSQRERGLFSISCPSCRAVIQVTNNLPMGKANAYARVYFR